MTRIDFYILPAEGGTDPLVAASRLCDKAFQTGASLFISSPNSSTLSSLSDLLWTHRQGSFLAHERFDGRPLHVPIPRIVLGESEPPATSHDILMNLGETVPDFFSRFERVLEIVPGDPNSRSKCRERFKFYRERGYALRTFEQTPDGTWQQKTA